MATATRLSITRQSAADIWIAENPAPKRVIPEGHVMCRPCMGSGSIVSRYGGPEGCFPDEDTCPTCRGNGYLPLAPHCPACDDAGELPVMDVHGDLDSTSVDYCTCLAGQMLAANDEAVQQVRDDYERALAEQAHADDLHTFHMTNIAAGSEPF